MGNEMGKGFPAWCPPFLSRRRKRRISGREGRKNGATVADPVETYHVIPENTASFVLKASQGTLEFKDTMELLTKATDEECEEFKGRFDSVADEDGEVDAWQLREALNSAFAHDFEFDGFSVDMCKSMVALMDRDMSGQLGYDEANELWSTILAWRNTFKELDEDNDGVIEVDQFESALETAGVSASGRTAQVLKTRYSNKEGKVTFEDFISCLLKIKAMAAAYQQQNDITDGSKARFNIDEFIQMTVYC